MAAKASSPDARHRPIMAELEWFYRAANGQLPMPSPGRTAKMLKQFLSENPAWPLEACLVAIRNKFFSRGINNAAPPYLWIRDLAKWSANPLNQWGQPLQEDATLREQMAWWQRIRNARAAHGEPR